MAELGNAKHEFRLARLQAIVAADIAVTELALAYASRAIKDPKNSRPRDLSVLDLVQGVTEQAQAKADQQRDAIKQLLELVKQIGHAFEEHEKEQKRFRGRRWEEEQRGARGR